MRDRKEYFDRLDAWLYRDEGIAPGTLLRERGLEFPDSVAIDDAALAASLWKLIEALADIGVFVEYTDHLTDRELYDLLVREVLPKETFLMPDDPDCVDHMDMSWFGESWDYENYFIYYADDAERKEFAEDGALLSPRKPLVADRDERIYEMQAGKRERPPSRAAVVCSD
jgi:hypothetical protein